MPGRKHTFPCGHKGRGQYCHRCETEKRAQAKQRAEEQAEKRAWKESFQADPIDLSCLQTKAMVIKARQILERIAAGAPYTDFLGKRMKYDRNIISVPVSPDYRMLFEDTGSGLIPLECLTHEAYNAKKPGS